MAGVVIVNNIMSFAQGGETILNPLIEALWDEDRASYETNSDTVAQIGYKTQKVMTPNGVFSSILGSVELPSITEGQDLPIIDTGKNANKSYEVKMFGGQIGISKLMRKWIETAKTLDGADSSVKAEWENFANNVRALLRGIRKSKNILATEVLTSGWVATSSDGPGSPTPYGKALFAADHPFGYGANAGTFRNTLGGSYGTTDDELNSTSLQYALDILKAEVRLQNGDRVDTPSKYKLFVSRANATNARKILNTAGNQVGVYSGAGNNAMQLNQFSFQGNIIELVELPFLGYRKDDGSLVGTDAYWFVCNCEFAEMAGAFRHLVLWEPEVRLYENHSNGTTFVAIDSAFTCDHYDAQSYIVGSRGTA